MGNNELCEDCCLELCCPVCMAIQNYRHAVLAADKQVPYQAPSLAAQVMGAAQGAIANVAQVVGQPVQVLEGVQQAPQQLTVTCPKGSGPGSQIIAQTPDGRAVNILVPQGVGP